MTVATCSTVPSVRACPCAAERLEFTVLGDAVNVTACLCAGAEPRQTLVTGELQAYVREQFWTREKTVSVNHSSPFQAWEIATPNDSSEPQ